MRDGILCRSEVKVRRRKEQENKEELIQISVAKLQNMIVAKLTYGLKYFNMFNPTFEVIKINRLSF